MAELDTTVTTETEMTAAAETAGTEAETEAETKAAESAEIARLKAEMAKQKAALDKATKEAGDIKKQLRAKQTAEEAAAEEAKAQQDAMRQELETLRKERTVAATTAKVIPLVGNNEAAGKIASYLYGAEDAEAALDELQRAWTAKEKALKLEYSKIPAPAAGGSNGPTVTREQLDAMKYMDRAKFANEHPEEYAKLMGR